MSRIIKAGRILIFLFLLSVLALCCARIVSDYKKTEGEEQTIEKIRKEKSSTENKKSYKNMVGWVEIPDTDFSYPVMQKKGDNEYYLHRDVKGNYSFCGTPYLDCRCSLNSRNLILYGHNINGRRFFGFLQNYRDYDFYNHHDHVIFDFLSEKEPFEVVSVIKTDTTSVLYRFTDPETEEEMMDYLDVILGQSMYLTREGEVLKKEKQKNKIRERQFLTFSTCRTGEGEDARLLVVASRILEKES